MPAKPAAPVFPPPAAGAPAVAKAETAVPEGLNVILLTVDTLRADLGYALTKGSAQKLSVYQAFKVAFEVAALHGLSVSSCCLLVEEVE